MSKRLLLLNAGVVTMNAQRHQYNDGAVLIADDRIVKIGPSRELVNEIDGETEPIDLRGHWILPGLINTHVHTSQQLGRGLADDVDLLTWLHKRVWPYESNLSEEDSYVSTLLCGIEQIRSGVTCFAEAGGQFVNSMGRGVAELGLRGILTRSTMDMGEGLPSQWQEDTNAVLDVQIANYDRWHGKANGRIRVWFGLRTIFNNSDELIVRTKKLADSYGAGIHMHVAELREENEFAQATRGAATVTHLDKLGVLDKNFLAVHSVWLTEDEIQLFAKRNVKVSHNPAAATRVLGFAKIPEMIDAGICVALGTDGAPTSNRMTLIDDMWLASLIHKGRLLDPMVMPAEQILAMVTCDGAKALLWEDEIGSLEVGKKADLVVVNPNTATMLPMHDPIANLVYAMREHNVESVMCNGRWLMRDHKILTVNEAEVLKEAVQRAKAISQRAGIEIPNRFNILD
ncbi:amidohydrolase [Leptolyngbya sp. FACHB-261]|uniref:amidohydrolase n=1 Tax=Leptolyngbya sp. FACHB-261 TaxID=2692806 RepID=UPI001682E8E2|nr:amidohydrolase [Leptolyngbya sp. FACHB-261]MBD2100284.1 amidohydrolase [Leptolyngbya sp. FACHB-261]